MGVNHFEPDLFRPIPEIPWGLQPQSLWYTVVWDFCPEMGLFFSINSPKNIVVGSKLRTLKTSLELET